MMEKGKMERGVVELVDTESLVPQEYLLHKVDKAVDFRKLYEIVEPLYSEEDGQPRIDPVVLFRIVLLQHLDGIPSLLGSLRRAQTDIEYRWFWGYTLNEELPHFSTVSYNFRHRFTEEAIEKTREIPPESMDSNGILELLPRFELRTLSLPTTIAIFFTYFSLVHRRFYSISFAFQHSLKAVFPYIPRLSVAVCVVRNRYGT